ncbi:KOW domain-containing RNA-binding protein [Halocella sp. SP3-1]|uniref:KOW domain-containing RNA-binding protein n=1 Tax=Halocella sp. SP3-1 TaxID=2382161 RepID=UPI000F74DB9C|nr:KOW domain-containing RNA-binding protein [Halocella sp. SP3-1]AZO96524.1 RNA-binding protein [Halocella sp. SP3-1]MTI60557.1 RNA-binding protein [Bacillota bacterium]
MSSRFELGDLVISTAGRDEGKYYLVVKIVDEDYIQVSDGDKKRIENPKRKNIKHVRPAGYHFEEISIWLLEGKRVRNEDIKKAIKDYQKNEEAK